MRASQRWFTVAAVTTLVSASLTAQASHEPRHGFYASLGFGLGSENETCDGCLPSTSTSTTGSTGYLAIGGTLSPIWRLGFESDVWTKSSDGVSQTLAFYNVMATYYPSARGNLWLKGGLGYSLNRAQGFGSSASVTGFSGGVGLGFDWLPGDGSFAIIPYVNYMYQFSGGNPTTYTSATVKASLLQLGLGLGYRH